MIISYNSSYEEVEEFILNHNNSLVCNDLGELFLLKDYLWLVSQQTQHKYLLSEELPDLLNLLLDHKELADEPYSELLSFRQVLREPALTVFTMKEFESQFIFIRTATGISKINRSGFLSTYYTISEEKVFQIQ